MLIFVTWNVVKSTLSKKEIKQTLAPIKVSMGFLVISEVGLRLQRYYYLRVGNSFARRALCLLLLQLLSSKGIVWITRNKIHVQRVLWGHSEVIAVSLNTLQKLFWRVLFQNTQYHQLSNSKKASVLWLNLEPICSCGQCKENKPKRTYFSID